MRYPKDRADDSNSQPPGFFSFNIYSEIYGKYFRIVVS